MASTPRSSIHRKPIFSWKNAGYVLLGIGFGLGLAEGFLRLIMPVEIRFETWLTPGYHQYDSHLGYVGAPNYSGMMRHPDKRWAGRPIQNDAHGFRLPNTHFVAGEDPLEIVALGGRSIMMSYGLIDEQSITGVIAKHLGRSARVHNTAWPGWNLYMNWLSYRREIKTIPKIAIIVVYDENAPSYAHLKNYELQWKAAPETTVFPYIPNIHLWPSGLVKKVGPPAYKSYLLYGILRLIDQLNTQKDPASEPVPPNPTAEDWTGFVQYLDFISGKLEAEGTQVLLVSLPKKDAPKDHYDSISEALNHRKNWTDLHRELFSHLEQATWIANDHYDTPLAEEVGLALTRLIQKELDQSPTEVTVP